MREGGAISRDLVFKSLLGLLLYAAGYNEQIQLLQLGYAGIQFARYYTESPDEELKKDCSRHPAVHTPSIMS